MTRQRIVIVGAGPAGLSTAAHLTDPELNPGWEDRYEISVYQMGWRVGGKGATGRNPEANERIQEHGIHVFGNMYFNSFAMVGSAYEQVEWDDHDRHRSLTEAFRPSTFTWNMDWWGDRWHEAVGRFPFNDAHPWDSSPPTEEQIAQEIVSMVSTALAADADARAGSHASLLGRLVAAGERILARGVDSALARIGGDLLDAARGGRRGRARHALAMRVLGAAVGAMGRAVRLDPDDAALRINYTVADLAVTILRGILEDDVLTKGLDSIDGENYDTWLRRHGASELTMSSSTPQVFPNTALGYLHGDTTAVPTMSAAAYATFFLRQVTGSGAGAYFFAEGTGETIMKPLYRLLEQRGVRFHFFHKLTDVVAAPDATEVQELRFAVQATVSAGSAEYRPLRRLADGELVWPDRPLFDQLVEGSALEESGADLESWWSAWEPVGSVSLTAGADFDQVVLATPVATLPHVATDLLRNERVGARWSRMVGDTATAASQAVQVWFDRSTRDLGWDRTPGPAEVRRTEQSVPGIVDRYVGCLYQQDLTSFCDFSDLVAEERWPVDNTPKGLVYFIGALSDPEEIPGFHDHAYPDRELERARWATVQYLRTISDLMPGAVGPDDPRSLDFSVLSQVDPGRPARGVNRFADQYVKVNIDPNERYTLSVPGTVRSRLHQWEAGFDNLVLAGDWTYTGFNVGSFEGAVMSGMLATTTLTGSPRIDQVVGYRFLHPDLPPPPEPRIPPGAADR